VLLTLDLGVLLLSIRKSSSVITESECSIEALPLPPNEYVFRRFFGLASTLCTAPVVSASEFFDDEECGLPKGSGRTEKRVLVDGEIDELLVVVVTPPLSGFSSTLVPPAYNHIQHTEACFKNWVMALILTLKRPLIFLRLLFSTPFFFL